MLASECDGDEEARRGTFASASTHTRVTGQLGGTTSMEKLELQRLKFHVSTKSFKNKNIYLKDICMDSYAENANICHTYLV